MENEILSIDSHTLWNGKITDFKIPNSHALDVISKFPCSQNLVHLYSAWEFQTLSPSSHSLVCVILLHEINIVNIRSIILTMFLSADHSEVFREQGNSGLKCVHVPTGLADLFVSLPLHLQVLEEQWRHPRLANMGTGVRDTEQHLG